MVPSLNKQFSVGWFSFFLRRVEKIDNLAWFSSEKCVFWN